MSPAPLQPQHGALHPGPAGAPDADAPVRSAARRASRLVTAAAVVAVAVHLWGLYRDVGPPTPSWFPQADKLEHLVGFGLPCFLVLLALRLRAVAAGRRLRTRTVVLVAGAFAVHAVVSEVVQGELYTTRTGDPFDALADVTGTLLGVLGFLLVRRSDAGRSRGGA